MPLYKWFVIIISVVMTLIYPEYVFGAIGVLLLVIILLLVVIDVVADVYIIVAVFLQRFRDK